MLKVFSSGRTQKDSIWGNATGNKIIFKWVKLADVEKPSRLVCDYKGQAIVKEIVENGDNRKILSIRSIHLEKCTNSEVECLTIDCEVKLFRIESYWKPLELDGSLPKGAIRVDAHEYHQRANIYVGRKFCEGVGRVELRENRWIFIAHGKEEKEISFGFEVLCNNWK